MVKIQIQSSTIKVILKGKEIHTSALLFPCSGMQIQARKQLMHTTKTTFTMTTPDNMLDTHIRKKEYTKRESIGKLQ